MNSTEPIAVNAQMLIRRPAAEVFEAIVNPEITTRFWFTRSSGRLEPGKTVRWEWEMFDVGDEVLVQAYELNQRLLLQWASDRSTVEWRFDDRGDETTLVTIETRGYPDDPAGALSLAVDNKGGYTLVLAGLKAWLEQGVELNLIRDQFPDS